MSYLDFLQQGMICSSALDRIMPKLKAKYGIGLREQEVADVISKQIWQRQKELSRQTCGENLISKLAEEIPGMYDRAVQLNSESRRE